MNNLKSNKKLTIGQQIGFSLLSWYIAGFFLFLMYFIGEGIDKYVSKMGLVIAFCSFVLIGIFQYIKKIKIDKEYYLHLSILFVFSVMVLPLSNFLASDYNDKMTLMMFEVISSIVYVMPYIIVVFYLLFLVTSAIDQKDNNNRKSYVEN